MQMNAIAHDAFKVLKLAHLDLRGCVVFVEIQAL